MRRARNWSVAGAVAAVVALIGCGVAQAAPSQITLQLSPDSITADGGSQATATATVTGAVSGQTVVDIFATDPRVSVSSVQPQGNGVYTATVTSSLTPGPETIVATVQGTALTAGAVLTQTAASTTYLMAFTNGQVSPTNLPVTNQPVTLLATVTADPPGVSPAGTVTFTDQGTPISGCASVPTPTGGSTLLVTCATSFAAADSSAVLAATFSPAAGTFVQTSGSTDNFNINRDLTFATVTVGSPSAHIGAPVTYTALVTPTQLGPAEPSGSVAFLDGGHAIPSCAARPLSAFGTATCALTYATSGTHAVSAAYSGDASFTGASSRSSSVDVVALGTIQASMVWTFAYTPAGTRVASLQLDGLQPGMSVRVICSGRGCPLRRRTVKARRSHPCRMVKGRRSCGGVGPLDLARVFRGRILRPGTVITVEIIRAGWTGKVYRFKIGPGREPLVQISCLAPGRSRPGVGC